MTSISSAAHQVFEHHPEAFFAIAFTALAAFLWCTLAPTLRARTAPPPAAGAWTTLGYCASLAGVLFAWRWPLLLYPTALNPDEAQMTANAMRAMVDPVPWRGFDGTTSGPLNSDVLTLAALVGARIEYLSARIIGLLLVIGALCALYAAVRACYGDRIARLCVVPPVLVLSFVHRANYVHYASELLPIFLTTVGLACAAFLATARGSRTARLVVAAIAGAALGCAPYAKLQAIPIAVAVLLYVGAAIATAPGAKSRRVEGAAAASGLLFPSLAILGVVAFAGEWDDFVRSYFENAVTYIGNGTGITLTSIVHLDRQYRSFLGATLAACCACATFLLVARKRGAENVLPLAFASSVALLAASLGAIYEAHRPLDSFEHYVLLSIVPFAWFLTHLVAASWKSLRSADVRAIAAIAFVGAFAVPALALLRVGDIVAENDAWTVPAPQDPVVAAIARRAPRDARIAVWGWAPAYYVESETVMATRDAETLHQMIPGPSRDYFRSRYMADIAASRPQLIVDAVAPHQRLTDPAMRLESFPQLASLVRDRYVFAESVSGVRIFRLRDEGEAPRAEPDGETQGVVAQHRFRATATATAAGAPIRTSRSRTRRTR